MKEEMVPNLTSPLSSPSSGILRKFIASFKLYSSKPFYYNLSGQNFSLDEMKHGILRGNKRSPNAYLKALSWNDPKA